jgi:WD40 repeat protein
MSRIFLSHSSYNNREALALKVWLESQGWKDEVFLDLDPESGIKTGTRWKEALAQANSRCEAIICLTSPEWVNSPECVAEYRTAENFRKRIFVAQIAELGSPDKTREWQGCRLFGEGLTTEITLGPQHQPVRFVAEGLTRLKHGLLDAGISGVLPKHFPWPPESEPSRAPYRGLEPLECIDAGVYFGRDAEILRGLAELERMRLAGDVPIFVILGASGAGKSSFLRAGLLPRLTNDDRHFFPLEVIRPERTPLYGDRGLAHAVSLANSILQLMPVNQGAVKSALKEGPQRFAALLHNIQKAAHSRLLGLSEHASPPTLVLSVDQAEELFNADATEEARAFLNLIGSVLRGDLNDAEVPRVPIIVAFTIRSDRYEPLQTAAELAGLKTVVFDALRPMPPAQCKEVITGPASRALVNGKPIEVRPDLVNQLLDDCAKGADALPLLGLTLARLYQDYGKSDGDLLLDEYVGMGGMADVIRTESESVLAADPDLRKNQLEALHAAFIPWLVTINPDNDQPMRRVARMSDLPPASHPLVRALIEKRLLLSDLRDGRQVVEVAHESLLRQWKVLADWLREEREDLKEADRLEQDAKAWTENGKKEAWLREGERLRIGDALAAKPTYRERLKPVSEFLLASRRREAQRREEEERVRQGELRAAQEKQRAAEALAAEHLKATERAQADAARLEESRTQLIQAFRQASALRLTAEAPAMLSGARAGGATLGLLKLLAAYRIAPHIEIEGAMLAQVFAFERVEKIIEITSPVGAVAFSPDGHCLVSGSADKTLRLWDAQTGQPIGEPLRGHEGSVLSVAFSPDGTRLVSGSDDETLRLWDVQTRQPLGLPLRGHERWVSSVAFSSDGCRLVSGSADKTIRLWDVQTGQPLGAPLQGHEGWVSSVAFSPDGTRLVSGSHDQTLRLWDAQTGQPLGESLRGHEGWVLSVAFNPDGRRLVSGSADKTLRLWDAQTGQPLGESLRGHEGWVLSVAFSPDGCRLSSGSDDETLRLWDVQTGLPLGEPLRGHGGSVSSLACSRDGRRLVSGSADKTLRLWDVQAGQHFREPLRGHRGSVLSVAFSLDGSRLLSGSHDHMLQRWDVQTGQPLGEPLQGHEGWVSSVIFSPDGRSLGSGGDDKTVRLWDAQTGQSLGEPLHGHEGWVSSVAFSPDGTRLVSGSHDHTLRLWDVQTGQPIGGPLKGHEGWVLSVAFSPDGTLLVSSSLDKTLRLWDAQTGQSLGEPLQGHEGWVSSVVFSPGGRCLGSGSHDHTLRLWDVQTGQPLGEPLRGHEGWVLSVAFSPDGTRLVSGSHDQTLRLWDVQTGQLLGEPLRGHGGSVLSVAFSPDGTRLVSGSQDQTLRLWPAPKVWPDMLCAKLTRNMSRKEWREQVSPNIEYLEQCPGLPIPPDALTGPLTRSAAEKI